MSSISDGSYADSLVLLIHFDSTYRLAWQRKVRKLEGRWMTLGLARIHLAFKEVEDSDVRFLLVLVQNNNIIRFIIRQSKGSCYLIICKAYIVRCLRLGTCGDQNVILILRTRFGSLQKFINSFNLPLGVFCVYEPVGASDKVQSCCAIKPKA